MFASTLAVTGALALALIAGGALPGTVDQDLGDAPGDADYIVAADGSGTHETLEAAVAAARDGDTIAVRPGTYDVALEITSDISIIGDGDPEAVVLQRQDRGPIMALRDADVTVSGLTVSGPKAWLEVHAGSPVIDGVLFDRLGDSDPGWSASLSVGGGSTASVRDSLFTDSGRIDIIDSAATIAGIEVRDSGPIYVIGQMDGAAIEDSVFTATRGRNGALILQGAGDAVVEGNQFVDNAMGIKVENATSTIRDNTFRGNGEAIWVTALGDPNVEANTIEGNVVGIRVDAHRAPSIVGNRICDNETDLEFAEPNGITLSGNTICSE